MAIWQFQTTDLYSTSSYDAFGILIKTGEDTIIHFFREGSAHVNNKGKIVKQAYTVSTDTWGSRTTVYDDANNDYDSRDICGGIIGNNIYLFFHRRSVSGESYLDAGYIKSTDLTGSSWGSYVSIPANAVPFGALMPTVDGNTFLQTYYDASAGTVKTLETTDSGNNWAYLSTITGSAGYNEVSATYIGDSKIIALMRKADPGGYVGQSVSNDNGDTWSSVTDTNLGASTGAKIPFITYDSVSGNVIVMYHGRANPYVTKVSITSASIVYADAKAWNVPITIDSGYEYNGYPSVVKIDTNEYYFVYSKQVSASDADIYGGILKTATNHYWKYKQRIKFTIDHNDIDSELTDFPVTVFLTSSQAEEVFVEFDADEDFDRGQFTTSNDTPIPAEKELFDDSESKAIYHVKIPTVSASVDTCFYFYYDNDAPHNYSNISIIGGEAGEYVWNKNFKAVYHMINATTSTVLDSTGNSNDGTKKGINEPIEYAAGKIGKSQDFDGVDDYIGLPALTLGNNLTVEACVNLDAVYRSLIIMQAASGGVVDLWFGTGSSNTPIFGLKNVSQELAAGDTALVTGTDYYMVGTWDIDDIDLYINAGTPFNLTRTVSPANTGTLRIGDFYNKDAWGEEANGRIDEVRISDSRRTAAWIKATYNTLYDSLLTYGSEETETLGNVIQMGCNF